MVEVWVTVVTEILEFLVAVVSDYEVQVVVALMELAIGLEVENESWVVKMAGCCVRIFYQCPCYCLGLDSFLNQTLTATSVTCSQIEHLWGRLHLI